MYYLYFICFTYFLIATELVRCKPDYLFNRDAGGWLKMHVIPAIWEEAFIRCHEEGAVLASPLNKELAAALRSQMTQYGVSGHLYLGTHDLYSKGDYFSVEGVPLSDMDVKIRLRGERHSGIPNNYLSYPSQNIKLKTGFCLTLSNDGQVHFSTCMDPLPFICYKKLNGQKMNECGTFDHDYHLNQTTGSCYKVHHEKQTWDRAFRICAAEGGHLVILNDDEEARVIKDLIPVSADKHEEFRNAIHVGTVFWGKERIWTTIHGDRIEYVYNKWKHYNLDSTSNNNFRGVFIRDEGLKLLFSDKTTLKYVCEKSPKSKRYEDITSLSKK